RRDRQHAELVKGSFLLDWERIRHDDLADGRVLQPVDSRPRQHAVRGRDDHLSGAGVEEAVCGLDDRAPGVDHVVDDEAYPAVYITVDLVRHYLVRDQRIPGFVDERERAATQPVGPALRHPDPTRIRGHDSDPWDVHLVL